MPPGSVPEPEGEKTAGHGADSEKVIAVDDNEVGHHAASDFLAGRMARPPMRTWSCIAGDIIANSGSPGRYHSKRGLMRWSKTRYRLECMCPSQPKARQAIVNGVTPS